MINLSFLTMGNEVWEYVRYNVDCMLDYNVGDLALIVSFGWQKIKPIGCLKHKRLGISKLPNLLKLRNWQLAHCWAWTLPRGLEKEIARVKHSAYFRGCFNNFLLQKKLTDQPPNY